MSADAKFKVGDRVRCVRADCFGLVHGKESVVTGVRDKLVMVDGDEGLWHEYRFELVAPTLRIEAGKYYRTRDGRKVGPAVKHNSEDYGRWPWEVPQNDVTFAEDGKHMSDGTESPDDLVAEWVEPKSCAAAEVDNLRDEYGPRGPNLAELAAVCANNRDITLASIVERLTKLEQAAKPIKVGDSVTLKDAVRVTGFDKQNVNIVTSGGGSFVLPLTALTLA